MACNVGLGLEVTALKCSLSELLLVCDSLLKCGVHSWEPSFRQLVVKLAHEGSKFDVGKITQVATNATGAILRSHHVKLLPRHQPVQVAYQNSVKEPPIRRVNTPREIGFRPSASMASTKRWCKRNTHCLRRYSKEVQGRQVDEWLAGEKTY